LVKDVLEAEEVEMPSKVIGTIVKNAEGSPREALTMLDKFVGMDEEDIEEAIDTIKTNEASIIELCRAMAKNAKWKVIAGILKDLDMEAEEVRYKVLMYFSKALLTSGDVRTAFILSCFTESYIYSKNAGLILSCYNATELNE